ncbi:hypothetical protein P12x_001909 [Tundrisphaera lichenicola]|uniref:hypothetical protein n=1 Tax=Tundrisphaera lichenicola TaxID=2029860 RepID=UPI003EBAED02
MNTKIKPYVHIAVDSVDTVAFDAEGRFDPERHDHYPTFEMARDAALSCVELLLDEGDYDGEDHRDELERMKVLLEEASTFEELESQPGYQWFVARLQPALSAA